MLYLLYEYTAIYYMHDVEFLFQRSLLYGKFTTQTLVTFIDLFLWKNIE